MAKHGKLIIEIMNRFFVSQGKL